MGNKKFSVFLLIAVLILSLMGCQPAQKPDDPKPPASTEQSSEKDTSDESDSSVEEDTQDTSSEDTGNSDSTESTEDTENNDDDEITGGTGSSGDMNTPGISLSDIPAFSKDYYIVLNNNIPYFSTENLKANAYEYYSDLDALGRCGVAHACLGRELLPSDDREGISNVSPSGWHTTQYGSVPGASLYNRSHLIAHSLAGENDNEKNLISGTQHLNQREMTKFEDMVLDMIKEIGVHVMYRVTPFFEGNNLIATGVQMEAWSVEDNGESICFNVFIYNVQDNISIDYATGESYEINPTIIPDWAQYMVHKSKGKIHEITCSSVTATGANNRVFFATYEEALAYSESVKPSKADIECGNCHAYSEHN